EACAMSFPTPYERFEGEVLPEWIDYNGHMNLAYYTVLFDQATDILFDELGLGLDYRRTTQLGTFVAETHNRYERELLVGARVRAANPLGGPQQNTPPWAAGISPAGGRPPRRAEELFFPPGGSGGGGGGPFPRRSAAARCRGCRGARRSTAAGLARASHCDAQP